jgi:hypothetical protein
MRGPRAQRREEKVTSQRTGRRSTKMPTVRFWRECQQEVGRGWEDRGGHTTITPTERFGSRYRDVVKGVWFCTS